VIAASFTPGEQAALAVVAREVQARQVCVLPIDAIAALAGVSRSTVKNALRTI
jgi:DNA-binding MurR/RpiR family transcriptional regulator